MDNKQLEKIFEELEMTGSDKKRLDAIKLEEYSYLQNIDSGFDYLTSLIINDIGRRTADFLNYKNNFNDHVIKGINSSIYLPDFSTSELDFQVFGGVNNDNKDTTLDTQYDVASITKIFTKLLFDVLEKFSFIDENGKISDYSKTYNLGDFTFRDLMRLHGKLRTVGNVADANSIEEANEILKTIYLESSDRSENTYTDFGAIIIAKVIEEIFLNLTSHDKSISDIMNSFIFGPLDLRNTNFNPEGSNLSGNGNNLGLVHDPKTRALGGMSGAAGIFTTTSDLNKLSRNLFMVNMDYVTSHKHTIITKEQLYKYGEITFPHSTQSNKGNLGIYVKHPLGLEKTYTPSEFSTGSFSHQGFTGSVAIFDPNNKININILVNSIDENMDNERVKNAKPLQFAATFDSYLDFMAKKSILLLIIKKYYNTYYKDCKDIQLIKKI